MSIDAGAAAPDACISRKVVAQVVEIISFERVDFYARQVLATVPTPKRHESKMSTGGLMKTTLLKFVCALCCLSLYQQAPEARAQSSSQRINGTAVGIGGQLGGRSRQFTLIANNYTAPNQVRELNEALRRGGDEELLRTLSRMDAGRIQIGNGVGVRANAIIADPWGEGGTK